MKRKFNEKREFVNKLGTGCEKWIIGFLCEGIKD